MSAGIRVERYRTLKEINPGVWDSANGQKSLFKSHKFLSVLEDAKVENSEFWYLLFYRNDLILGSCSLCSFEISLDLFLDGFSRKLVRIIRSVFPGFLNIRILFCGTPLSVGKNSILVTREDSKPQMLDRILEETERICRENNIHFISIKEFFEKDTLWLDRIQDYGYLKCPSLPYVSMTVSWESFEEYLASLRHKYRRQILGSIDKVDFRGLITVGKGKPDPEQMPFVDISVNQTCDPDLFHKMYLDVMGRSNVVLEVLNIEFFRLLWSRMEKETMTVSIKYGDRILGSALLAMDKDVLVFLLVGMDYEERDRFDVYFNLVYAILGIAIKSKVRRLDLGQTTYYVKQRIGGDLLPMFFYIKSRKKTINWLLKKLSKVLFPVEKISKHRVFSSR